MPDLPPPVLKMTRIFGLNCGALIDVFERAADALDAQALVHTEHAIDAALEHMESAQRSSTAARDCVEAAMSFRSAVTELQQHPEMAGG